MTAELRNLDYAPRPAMRRRVLGRIAWLLLAITVAWAGWRWGPPMWAQCRYLHCQHEAMTYTTSPGQVALELDQMKAVQLLATNGDYQAVPKTWGSTGMAPRTFAALYPKCIRSLFPYNCDGVAFLHERRSPDGQRRLIVAPFYVTCDYTGLNMQFWAAEVWKPASLRPGSRVTRTDFDFNNQAASRSCTIRLIMFPVKIYAGVPDPVDESHFTITLMVRAANSTHPHEPFVIDGWLRDGSKIEVRPRHSATTARIGKTQVGLPDW